MMWLLPVARLVCGLTIITVALILLAWAWASLTRPKGRHETPAAAVQPSRPAPGYTTGSMVWDAERAYLIRRDGIVHIDDRGDVVLEPWEPPHSAEAAAGLGPKQELWNGHTFGCLVPQEDHPGACPEEGDDPDDPHRWPVPDLPPADGAGPADVGAGLVDTALALAADDPGNAGWTDQLLADLREAPTWLDDGCRRCGCPTSVFPLIDGLCSHCLLAQERVADTGEIGLASLRADFAAELRAQDDDAAEFSSRLASEAAAIALDGLT